MRRIMICFAAVLSSLFVLCSRASAQCTQNCPERRTISVTAMGSVTADADLAIVRVGYKLYGPDAKSAYASASETSNAIMQALNGSVAGQKYARDAESSKENTRLVSALFEVRLHPLNDAPKLF